MAELAWPMLMTMACLKTENYCEVHLADEIQHHQRAGARMIRLYGSPSMAKDKPADC